MKIDDLQWLRLLYAYPDGISDELLDLMASEEKICNYLDVPLQHIDDTILAMMNRRVDEAAIRDAARAHPQRASPMSPCAPRSSSAFPARPKSSSPGCSTSSTRGISSGSGFFATPGRRGRRRPPCTEQIPERVKKARYHKLMKAQSRVSFRKNRALVGRVEPVLVEGYSEETELLLRGRSIRQAPDVDGQVYITAGQAEIGTIVPLRITDSSEYDLIGEIAED